MSPILGIIAAQAVKSFLTSATIYFASTKFGNYAIGSTAKSVNDGTSWITSSVQNAYPTGTYIEIVYDNFYNRFTAITGNNKNDWAGPFASTIAARSTDGVTWNTSNMPANFYAQDVDIRSNSTIVAVGLYDQIARSTDGGATWTGAYSSQLGGQYRSIASKQAGQAYVWIAVEDNASWYALSVNNGQNWSYYDFFTSVSTKEVSVANGYFFMTSNYSNGYAVSTNGYTWTEYNGATQYPSAKVRYINGMYVWFATTGSNTYSYWTATNVAGPWTERYFTSGQITGNSIAAASTKVIGNRLYAVRTGDWQGGAGNVISTTDGINWTEHTLNISAFYSAIAGKSDNTNSVLVSYADSSNPATGLTTPSTIYSRSTNGTTWNLGTSVSNSFVVPTSQAGGDPLNGVAVTGNGRSLVRSLNNKLMITTNGTTWTIGNTAPQSINSGNNAQFVFGAGKFIICNQFNYDGTVATTTDGLTWSQSLLAFTPNEQVSISYGTNKFVMLTHSNGATQYSTDGVSWTSGGTLVNPNPNSNRLAGMQCVNGTWVAYTSGGGGIFYSFTSTDGISWSGGTARSVSNAGIDGYGTSYALNNKLLIPSSFSDQLGTFYGFLTTTNGISWSTSAIGYNYDDYFDKMIYGKNSYIVWKTDTWTQITTFKRSTDLNTWTSVNMPYASNIHVFVPIQE